MLAPLRRPGSTSREKVGFLPILRARAGRRVRQAGAPGRPCLLIHGPDRTGRDVLIALLNRPGARKPPKVIQVNSRALLERLARDGNAAAVGFLDLLCDESNQKTVWFFDSLHRYLSEELAPTAFRLRFVQWLKQTNSRFLFAVPQSQYDKVRANNHSPLPLDWKDTFQQIWIHSPSPASGWVWN